MFRKHALPLCILLLCALLLSGCGGPVVTDHLSPQTTPSPLPAAPAETPSPSSAPEDTPPSPEPTPEPLPLPALNTETRYLWPAEGEPYYICSYATLALAEDSAAAYPGLAASLRELADAERQTGEASQKYLAEAAAELEAQGATLYNPLTGSTEITLSRADAQAVGVLIYEYWDLGGVHPSWAYRSVNYDTQTGRVIGLTDVIDDLDAMREALIDALITEYSRETFFDLEGYLAYYSPDDYTWVLAPDGVMFQFSPYEIAPFAAGAPSALLSFAAHPELFTGRYTVQTGDYVRPFSLWSPFTFNPSADGSCDTLLVTCSEDEYGTLQELTIEYNGVVFTDTDVMEFNPRPYLFHTEAYGDFLYVQIGLPNDYQNIYVYRLSDGGVTRCGDSVPYGFAEFWQSDGDCAVRTCPTNPGRFVLSRTTHTVYSSTAYGTFRVGADGMPEQVSPFLTLASGRELTVLQRIEFPLVDEAGEPTGGTVQLSPGDVVVPARTDGRYLVDLRLADGRLCRLEITPSDYAWPGLIQGYELEELFDGVFFVG